MGISLKVNAIRRQDFEVAYFEATVQHISHYITGSSKHTAGEKR